MDKDTVTCSFCHKDFEESKFKFSSSPHRSCPTCWKKMSLKNKWRASCGPRELELYTNLACTLFVGLMVAFLFVVYHLFDYFL